MKLLWRISNHCDLSGVGGEKADGRWHTAARGKRIVYLSEHPALALVEALANLKGNPKLFPQSFQLMKVAMDDSVSTEVLGPHDLPPDWRDDTARTRALGNAWLTRRAAVLLKVPSVVSPESENYLLNPLHPHASGPEIEWCKWIQYDKRLFHL